MVHTKSIRLDDKEVGEIQKLQETLRYPTEAALLKRAFLLGLDELRMEMAVRLYTIQGLSIGETAQAVDIPVPVLLDAFHARGIRTFAVPPEDEAAVMGNLARQARRYGASRLADAAEQRIRNQ